LYLILNVGASDNAVAGLPNMPPIVKQQANFVQRKHRFILGNKKRKLGHWVPQIKTKASAPVGSLWMWTLTFGHHEDRIQTHGYARVARRLPLTDSGRATLTAILEDAEIGITPNP
jgi:hypothetical protein